MERKTIGKVQVAFGILVILIVTVADLIAVNGANSTSQIISGTLSESANGMMDKTKIAEFNNVEFSSSSSMMASANMIGPIFQIAAYAVMAFLTIIVVLISITAILQGLANMAEK